MGEDIANSKKWIDGLVSIIIPAYNAGKHLQMMLGSIYAQTYQYLEVIVAYDIKSTDNTLAILRDYEIRHGLIIDEGKDSSSGEARNRGLKLAKGEYIIFMDADDLIIPSYIEDLIDVFVQHPELNVVCGEHVHSEEMDVETRYSEALSSPDIIQLHSQKESLQNMIWGTKYYGEPWTWLVKRDYIDEYNVHFPNYSYGDDTVYVFQLILNTDKVGYTTKIGYIFIIHTTSLTNSVSSNVELWDKRTKARTDIVSLLSEKHPRVLHDYLQIRLRSLAREFTKLDYSEYRKMLEYIGIQHLSSTECDPLLSKLSLCVFNISKWMYWKMLRTSFIQKKIGN